MALTPGTRLGPYEISAQIGAGGMGEVYRATDTNLKRQVAIKVLPESLAGDPERLARFRREAELLAQLNHPNIAQVHGLEKGDGHTALVMELVEGPTLADMLGERAAAGSRALPLDEAFVIARQIAEALEAAHEHGIIHRDLKPANLKVRPDGTVKVLDFGLAKAVDNPSVHDASRARPADRDALSQSPTITTPAMTRAGVLLGTAAYMSPEQARGRVVDRRADIWAFGCVFFEMLTGERAFAGDDVVDTITAVIHKTPDWSKLPSATPRTVRRLVARCLDKDPRQRLRDIGEARVALDQLSDGETVDIVPDPAAARRRLRPVAAVAIACLAALVAAFVTAWALGSRPRVSPDSRGSMEVALPLLSGESTEPLRGLAVSSDGQAVAFVARGAGRQPRLTVRRLRGGGSTDFEGTSDAAYPFFSPDGLWVAFFADDALKKVPTAGGIPQVILAVSTFSRGSGGAWAEDGSIFFARSGGIWKVPSSGGQAEQITVIRSDRGEISHLWPLLVNHGATLIYVVWTGPGWDERHVVARQLTTGTEKVLLEGAATVRYASSGHLIYSREGRLSAVAFDASRTETTGPPVRLFDDVREGAAAADYDLSPSGTLIYVRQSRGAYDRVPVLVDRRGTGQLLPGVTPGFYQNPRFSPDGRRALLQRADSTVDLWLYNFDRQTMTKLRADGSSQNPTWSPDGGKIVYRGTRKGFRNLFVRPVDGVSQEERLTDSPNVQLPWSWKAGAIAFTEQAPDASDDIWLLPMDGHGPPSPVLRTPVQETKPRLSPDGKTVAYVSAESGRNQIFTLAVTGANREQVSTDGGTDPVWSSDGRELFYRNGSRVMTVSVDRGGRVASLPHLLFEGNYVITAPALDFDVSPDGQTFLMLRTSEPEAPPAHLELFLNWNEELARLVPTGR
jgi:Tol biopolymer transport system component/tRNA A-37 threonylcarbamoyl transferase component Bud32